MSTSPADGRPFNRRVESLQSRSNGRSGHNRNSSYFRKRHVSSNEAYLFALRVAFLIYQLQPRAKRTQHVPAPPQAQKSSTSINDLMKDFSLIRDSKSTRFPSRFMDALIKRMSSVMVGTEAAQEYKDAAVKRTFASALNAFMEPGFRKRMEKDRRVEDLILIFFSNAAKELQKGKAPGDQSFKSMADRHVALFVRLISRILRDEDWANDHPELATRLQTMEQKLLANDQDLTSGGGTQTIEVLVPLSMDVKDMPMVQTVARIFGYTNAMAQSEITAHKHEWTPEAALNDIKTYQTLLNLNSPKTLRSDDFDLEEAYDSWKRGEAPDLSQMILAIVMSYPELAKMTSVHNQANFNLVPTRPDQMNSAPVDISRQALTEPDNPYVLYQPQDIGFAAATPEAAQAEAEDHTFTFIPSDPRSYYKAVLSACLVYDIENEQIQQSGNAETLLSKHSTELLNELCLRWRIPFVSRAILFLDVVREKFLNNELSLDQLDAAFQFAKAPLPEKGKDPSIYQELILNRDKWLMADFILHQQILASVHTALLRDLMEILLQVYEPKHPSPSIILMIIGEHVEADPSFNKPRESDEEFKVALENGLKERARDMYRSFLEKNLPQVEEEWEFYHIIEVGKAVTNFSARIQKRYRKNPEVMGVNPLVVLLQTLMPLYAEDSKDIVARILQVYKNRGEEAPLEDGFILYREMVEIRNIHSDALPNEPFTFAIEDILQQFVWRWIKMTEETITTWVDNAIKQDDFKVSSSEGEIPTEEQRHSTSVIDMFTSFNQSIEKIADLQWDNDFQYAKFMTALSKIVGTGLARYCDVVNQKFAQEMNRLTPEQEALANQSRQERWMQIAKDAWSQRERIEPFNFFSTSFVKLNDIEFASRQLDKMEKEMNVDACVDVISRNAPPINQRQRKIISYVFTIKIVEAEDLKACDVNGLSDPYVVLGDEHQKRLAKTRIVYGNLNPRWDETTDITTTGPVNIVATIWDWDTLGDHDCVGRTSIKLDPSHFSDFMPREYWLDLDTQGRLLLRVNMEGERDDIQFYFGKAFRTLKRTEREMTRSVTDKLSAYIDYILSRRTLRGLLSKGISGQLSAVSGFLSRNRINVGIPTAAAPAAPTQAQIADALQPLFIYFDDNFAIMNQTLTRAAMISVMSRLWKEVLSTIEGLCVPPLSDKPSAQKPLTQQELDIVFRWLQLLYDFFAAIDPDTGEVNGVPLDVLRSPKYYDINTLNFFYFENTENLVRESERMASASANKRNANQNRFSAPTPSPMGGPGGLLAVPGTGRRGKSVLLSRNLGTMKKAKEEKRQQAQAEPSDDMILRILRMRPEAQRYLKDRSRQKERLAAAAAAQQIVQMSIKQGGGGRMTANLPRR